jgi:hypothetical protein
LGADFGGLLLTIHPRAPRPLCSQVNAPQMCCSRAKGLILGSILCSIAMIIAFAVTPLGWIQFSYELPAIQARYTSSKANQPAVSLITGGIWSEGGLGADDDILFPAQLTCLVVVLIAGLTALFAIVIGILFLIPKKPNMTLLTLLTFCDFLLSLGVNVYFIPLDMLPLAKNILDGGSIEGCASAAACPPENVSSVQLGIGWGIVVGWASSIMLLLLSILFLEAFKLIRAGRLSASDAAVAV